jgi:hypothetical protein
MSLLNALLGPFPDASHTLQGRRVKALEVGGSGNPEAEKLAASVLAENHPSEADAIMRVWRDLFGMDLDRDRVARHLENIRRWQSQWTR